MNDVQALPRRRRRELSSTGGGAMKQQLPVSSTIYMFVFLSASLLLVLLLQKAVPRTVSAFRSLSSSSSLHPHHHHNSRHGSSRTWPPWLSARTTTTTKRNNIHASRSVVVTYAANSRESENRRLFTAVPTTSENVWEQMAMQLVNVQGDPSLFKDYVNMISALRIGLPALLIAAISNVMYPTVALTVASIISDSGVFAVVSQDASQYIQNILTTSGLVFSLLVGQTFYFMYQQQEAIYLALFEEVTMAKSLLEQVALVCQGREALYNRILSCIDRYVSHDLQRFNDYEPAMLLSARPVDDPLEDILYLTSVGEPSVVYQTVRALRQARAYRLGALQRKLPPIHMTLLWVLFGIVLCTFPLLGAGSQTIGGMALLHIQAWYLSFIVFGMCLTLFMIDELQRPGEDGAYSARAVLGVMLRGLEEELDLRLQGKMGMPQFGGPSIDADGYNEDYSSSSSELFIGDER